MSPKNVGERASARQRRRRLVNSARAVERIRRAVEMLEPRQMLAAHVAGNPNTFATIQAAIDAAPVNGTVTVDPGSYTEQVVLYNGITLKGGQAGVDARSNARSTGANESVLTGVKLADGTTGFALRIAGNNCTVDGFTFQGTSSISTTTGAALVMAPNIVGSHVFDCIFQNNVSGIYLSNNSASVPAVIQHNLFRNNNVAPGNAPGRAIYTDGGVSGGVLQNVQIDSNFFYNNQGDPTFPYQPAIGIEAGPASTQTNITISNNVFERNGKAVLAYNASFINITGNVVMNHWDVTSAALRFEGGTNHITITGNNLYADGARAIRIDNKASSGSNNTFTITGNNIYRNGLDSGGENTGLYINTNGYDGALNATNNWWGSSSGPSGDFSGTGDEVQAFGANVTISPFATTPVVNQQVPWFGLPQNVDSQIEAENYDHGLEGVSYHDNSTGNSGGSYRPYPDVDIDTTSDVGGGYVVTASSGEWIKYTVNAAQQGTYTLNARIGSGGSGSFHIEIDGNNVTGSVAVPNTGGSTTFTTITQTNVTLPAGVHVLRLVFDSGTVGNWNWFKFVPVNVGPPPPAPTAPTSLSAAAVSASKVNLTWTDTSDNEDNFILERSTDNFVANIVQVALPAANVTSFSDTTVAPGTLYYYRIRASNGGGPSANSNIATATTPTATITNYITAGAIWKYLDNGTNQGTAWTAVAFNDSTWKSGAAQLGYGDGDEATVVSFGSNSNNKFITTYFRKSFNVADASLVTALNLQLLRDDGAVVYLNGTEVFRSNMPTGTVTYTTLASTAVGGADESTFFPGTINPAALVTGTNVIAVEIHQADPTSSDISFDFSLTGTVSQPSTPPPAAPTGLAASAASSSQINLTWTDNSSDETGFVIERSTDNFVNNVTQAGTAAVNATSYNDSTGLSPATMYYYRVRAVNGSLQSSNSNIANATTKQIAPVAPSGLAASAVSTSQINLTWTDASNNETGFILERSTDNFVNNITQIATPAANATSYNDSTGLSASTQYWYRIRATNAIGDSPNSNVANATTLAQASAPAAPSGLAASAASSSQINLTWTDNSNNETNFILERSTDNFVANVTQIATPAANATSYNDSTGLSPGTKYYYRTRATNGVGPSANSNIANATTLTSGLPAGWSDGDIGAVGVAGSATFSGGVFTIKAAGADIWNTADAFNFVSQSLVGDGTIIARYTGQSGGGSTPFAGLMIRQSLAANSAHAALFIDKNNLIGFVRRTSAGATSTATTASGATPQWLKLQRSGSTFTASRSSDGNTWTVIGSATVSMTGTVFIGLAACGNSTTALVTTTLDNVSILTAPAAPSALNASTISSSQINLTWTDNANNETGFILERSTDNFVNNVTQIATPATNATSYNDSTGLSAGTTYYYRIRATNSVGASANSNIANATTSQAAPTKPNAPSGLAASAASNSQINLTWTDNSNNETNFILERSTDNFVANVTQIATPAANVTSYNDSTGLSAGTQYWYRIRATNGVGDSSNSNIASATTQSTTGIPAPWQQADVGSTGAAGGATYSNGVFSVSGSGNDVWSTADAFHYVYQPWSGDGQIVARVASQAPGTPNGAFGGVMFRETLAPNSTEASLFINTSNLIGFVRRTTTGGTSTSASVSASKPYWLKLIRSGSSFSAYRSPDGTTWTQVGSAITISMATNIFVGLAVCATSNTKLATITMDGVATSTSTSTTLAGSLSAPAMTQASSTTTTSTTSTSSANASTLLDLTA